MNFCVCYNNTNDPVQLAKAEQYDYVICNQDAPILNTQQLGYLQVATEIRPSRKPADKLLHAYANSYGDQFIITESGDNASVFMGGQHRRLWDYRKDGFARVFKEAAQLVIDTYGGLFLDNCAGNWAKMPEGQTEALQEILLDIRRANPDSLIVGNSAQNWEGLNGEMMEARANFAELAPITGQIQPNLNMVVFLTDDPNDPQIEINRQKALEYGAMFYACKNFQEVW